MIYLGNNTEGEEVYADGTGGRQVRRDGEIRASITCAPAGFDPKSEFAEQRFVTLGERAGSATVALSSPYQSNQEFTSDPDTIEVYFSLDFINRMEKAFKFMNDTGCVDRIHISRGLGYELFLDEDDDTGDPKQTFDPEYRLDPLVAHLYPGHDHGKSDRVRFVLPFRDNHNEGWTVKIFPMSEILAAAAQVLNEKVSAPVEPVGPVEATLPGMGG